MVLVYNLKANLGDTFYKTTKISQTFYSPHTCGPNIKASGCIPNQKTLHGGIYIYRSNKVGRDFLIRAPGGDISKTHHL